MDTHLQIFDYEGSKITFEKNGVIMVNATEMAKAFNKHAKHFLENDQTKDFIAVLEAKVGFPTLTVNHGGSNPGTWMHQKLALKFAAWLSPDFELWVYDRIEELLTTGKTEINHTLPQTYLDALKALVVTEEQKQLAEAKVLELQPKAEVFDKISNCNNLLTVAKVAKSLGTGQNKFFDWLRLNKILTKKNLPYQEYIDAGYFEVKVTPVEHMHMDYTQTYFTPKGQLWITEKYLHKTNKAA